MKNLFLAVLFVLLPGLFVFVVLTMLQVDSDLAKGIAAISLAAFPTAHQALEKRDKEQEAAVKGTLTTLKGFSTHWYLVLLYGTMLLVAAAEIAGILAEICAFLGTSILAANSSSFLDNATLAAIHNSNFQTALITLNLIAFPIVAFALGSWAGTRADRANGWLAFGVIFLGLLISKVIDFSLLDDATYQAALGQEKNLGYVLGATVQASLGYGIFALLGCWFGYRARLGRYMGYLLNRVDANTRTTIVDLSYDEAQRAATRTAQEAAAAAAAAAQARVATAATPPQYAPQNTASPPAPNSQYQPGQQQYAPPPGPQYGYPQQQPPPQLQPQQAYQYPYPQSQNPQVQYSQPQQQPYAAYPQYPQSQYPAQQYQQAPQPQPPYQNPTPPPPQASNSIPERTAGFGTQGDSGPLPGSGSPAPQNG